MCGRFGFIYPSKEDWEDALADLKAGNEFVEESYEAIRQLPPRYNIAPTQEIPTIVFSAKEQKYKVMPMFWGWNNPYNEYGQLHNANFGSVLSEDSKFWKKAFRERRCLIPATFFYDWQVIDRSKTKKKKLPWKITCKKYKIMFFAGLFIYQNFKKEEEKSLRAAFITQHGCDLMQKINNAENGKPPGTQPVILEYHKLHSWLNPAISEIGEVAKLISFYEGSDIDVVPLANIGDDTTHTDAAPRDWVDPYAVDTPITKKANSTTKTFG
jgi:putative SOS response-associated peptidase YedK